MTFIEKNNFFGLYAKKQDICSTHYALTRKVVLSPNAAPYQGLEFEKKSCRLGFRKAFGTGLPHAARVGYGLSLTRPLSNSALVSHNTQGHGLAKATLSTNLYPGIKMLKSQKCGITEKRWADDKIVRNNIYQVSKIQGYDMQLQLMSAAWLCDHIKRMFRFKAGARGILNNVLRDIGKSIKNPDDLTRGTIHGVRIVASGRLGKKKKGMAQTISRGLGKVPLSTLRSKIDYCQDFVTSSYGAIGLKIWICYSDV